MCGRFTLRTPLSQLAEQFLFDLQAAELPLRFNIAPTQHVATVRIRDAAQGRELALLRWGLIPFWAKDPTIANKLINARSESVVDKPSFRSAFRHRRCLVLADGYYEWKKPESGSQKQPYYIRRRDGRPFAFAGLWDEWPGGEHGPLETCTIITTSANDLTRDIHPRMPAILAPDDYTGWLDPRTVGDAALAERLRPYADAEMEAFPVSTLVNNTRNDLPECVVPLTTVG